VILPIEFLLDGKEIIPIDIGTHGLSDWMKSDGFWTGSRQTSCNITVKIKKLGECKTC